MTQLSMWKTQRTHTHKYYNKCVQQVHRIQDIQNRFLYINNEHIEAKIKYTIFIMTKIKTKYLGLILTMHVCTRRPCFTKKWWKKPST